MEIEPRKFIKPPIPRVRWFKWSMGGGKHKGLTFAAGDRVKMRYKQLLGVKDGQVVSPETPGAEPYFLLVRLTGTKQYSRGAGKRWILSNGDNYYDIKKQPPPDIGPGVEEEKDPPNRRNLLKAIRKVSAPIIRQYNRNLKRASSNYHDYDYASWKKRPWEIIPKSGKHRLTTLHQDVIKQIVGCFWQEGHPIHDKGTNDK